MDNALRALQIVAESWPLTFGWIALCGAILIARVTRMTADKEVKLARMKHTEDN